MFFPRIRIRTTMFRTRSRRLYAASKESARKIIHERVEYFNQYYQVSVKRISIRNQRSRWGSCSRLGNLNFNYKILFLTPAQRDYVIVHELCHLKEFNHGQRFWALVGERVPNYRELRKELQTIA